MAALWRLAIIESVCTALQFPKCCDARDAALLCALSTTRQGQPTGLGVVLLVVLSLLVKLSQVTAQLSLLGTRLTFSQRSDSF